MHIDCPQMNNSIVFAEKIVQIQLTWIKLNWITWWKLVQLTSRIKKYDLFTASVYKKKQECVFFISPIFNKAKYLNMSIERILMQDHKCLEVIAINDVSTDNS